MKKILYFDPFGGGGHINFNKVYIRGFLDHGLEVHLVMRKTDSEALGFPNEMLTLALPEKYYKINSGKFVTRVLLFRMLRFVKSKTNFNDYDLVLFAGYEEMTLFFANIKNRLFLLNHSNVSGLDNFIKRIFMRLISKKNVHIVFADFIKKRMEIYGIKNVIVEPLGLSQPYSVDACKTVDILYTINPLITNTKWEYIIFAPTGTKYSSTILSDIIENQKIVKYLEKKNILLVIKDKKLASSSVNILILHKYLSIEQYKTLFFKSDSILIYYPESFDFRVSAILFECFSNKRPCLLSEIESFRAFEKHFNYNPYFKNTEELIKNIDELILKKDSSDDIFKRLDSLVPKFSNIINYK